MLRKQFRQTGVKAAQIDERPWHVKYAIYPQDFFDDFFAVLTLNKILKDGHFRLHSYSYTTKHLKL